MNKLTIIGNLTRDPELRTTQSGTAVASFTLAVDRDFKDKSTSLYWMILFAYKSRYTELLKN